MHLCIRKKLWFHHQVLEHHSSDKQQRALHNLKPTQEVDYSPKQQARQRLIRKEDCLAIAALMQVHPPSSELQHNHRVRIRRLLHLNQAYLEHLKQQVDCLTRKPQQDLIHCKLRVATQVVDCSVGKIHLLQARADFLVKTLSKIDRLH